MANFVGRWEDTGERENFDEFATAMSKKIMNVKFRYLK